MNLALRFLKFCHPKAEKDRMKMRLMLAKAQAEAEDLTRTVNGNFDELKCWLNNGPPEKK